MEVIASINCAASTKMAFVAPVMKKDYDIYSLGFYQNPKTKPKKILKKQQAICLDEDDHMESDKKKKIELLKERRQRRYPKKKTKTVLRKISEINEESDEELYFNEMQKGFTKLRSLSEECESDGTHETEKSSPVKPKKDKKKKSVFGLFYWTPFSFRKKNEAPKQ